MRFLLHVFFILATGLAFLGESHAEVVTVGFTESVVSTAGGDPPLKDCTVHACSGATCTDFSRRRTVPASGVDGGGVQAVPVTIRLTSTQLPATYRFAISCRMVNGNESPLYIPGSGEGNPIEFE